MGYCTKEEVRKLTGLTDLELDDSQLEEIVLNAERQVNFETSKLEGWDPSDPEYSLIQTATKFYAAALCYETFPDDKVQSFGEKAERFRNEGRKTARSFGLRSPGAAATNTSRSSPRALHRRNTGGVSSIGAESKQ